MVEEAPYTSLASTTTGEVGCCKGSIERELGILTTEPTHVAGILNHTLGEHHVLFILLVEGGDTTLIGMGTDALVGNAQCHPHHTWCFVGMILRARCSRSHHLHDPCLVGIADREGLAFRIITVFLHQGCHHKDGLPSSLGSLESKVHQTPIVDDACGIYHLLTTAEGGLTDRYLKLVDITDNIISNRCLRNPSMVHIRVVVDDPSFLVCRMLPCRVMTEIGKHTIAVGTIRTEHTAVGGCFLPCNQVGAGHSINGHAQEGNC